MPSGKRSSSKRSSVGLSLGTRLFPCPRFRSLAVTLPRRSFRLRLPAAILQQGAPDVVALLDAASGVAADVAVVAARRVPLAFGRRLLRRPFLRCIFHGRLPNMSPLRNPTRWEGLEFLGCRLAAASGCKPVLQQQLLYP